MQALDSLVSLLIGNHRACFNKNMTNIRFGHINRSLLFSGNFHRGKLGSGWWRWLHVNNTLVFFNQATALQHFQDMETVGCLENPGRASVRHVTGNIHEQGRPVFKQADTQLPAITCLRAIRVFFGHSSKTGTTPDFTHGIIGFLAGSLKYLFRGIVGDTNEYVLQGDRLGLK